MDLLGDVAWNDPAVCVADMLDIPTAALVQPMLTNRWTPLSRECFTLFP